MKTHISLVVLVLFLAFSASAFAEKQESQVSLESKIVEISNTQVRDLGADIHHTQEIAQTRSLEHIEKTANATAAKNVFDFKPLELPSTQTPNPILDSPPLDQKITGEPHDKVPGDEQAQDTVPLQVDVKPKVDSNGNINMVVEPSKISTISEIHERKVPEGSVQQAPEKTPMLANLPFIGQFFKQKPVEKDLVTTVTPSLVQPDPDKES